jgi:hypothetical protein
MDLFLAGFQQNAAILQVSGSDAVVYIAYAVFIHVCATLLDKTPRGAPGVAEIDFGKKFKSRNSILKAFDPDGCSRNSVRLFPRYSGYVA